MWKNLQSTVSKTKLQVFDTYILIDTCIFIKVWTKCNYLVTLYHLKKYRSGIYMYT